MIGGHQFRAVRRGRYGIKGRASRAGLLGPYKLAIFVSIKVRNLRGAQGPVVDADIVVYEAAAPAGRACDS